MRTPFLILLIVTGTAAAEPKPIQVAPTVPPVFRLLAEPAVQKDIELTAEQKSAADGIARHLTNSKQPIDIVPFVRIPAESLRAFRAGMPEAFLTKTLTKAQRTRLVQIHFQLREKEFGPHAAFAMAARDLALQPDQIEDVHSLQALRVEEIAKIVTSGQRFEKIKAAVEATNNDTFGKMTEMLTRAQRERLKELKGRPFEGKLIQALPVEAKVVEPKEIEPKAVEAKALEAKKQPIAPAQATPARYPATKVGYYDLELLYCMTPALRNELKLSDAQMKAVAEAWDAATGGLGLQRGMVPSGWAEIVHAQTEKVFDKQLTKEQRSRFDQIMMQRRAKVSPEAVCTYPPAIAALNLSPNQLQQITSGKRLAEVLGNEQLARFNKLFGEPFALPLIMDDYLPAAAHVVADSIPVPKPGLFDLELKYLDTYDMGKILKLTDKQSGSIARAWYDFPNGRPAGRVAAGKEVEAHIYTAKVLAENLTPEQRARFDEMMMQRRAKISREAACTYPPAIIAMNLTDKQLKRLTEGERFLDVLTVDQQLQYTRLLGAKRELRAAWDDYLREKDPIRERFAPARSEPDFRVGPSKPYVPVTDFLILRDEFKLTDEQVKKFKDLAEDDRRIRELIHNELAFDDATPSAIGTGTPSIVVGVTNQYRAVVEKQCWSLLNATQKALAGKTFGKDN
ncbi:MAG TPA: hypothetical protein VHR66_10020 [Gemmataceae bacterium]|jgi:hypothetical protein|nr:hypothetical protein [Gemmataceae bacterium]